MSFPRLPPSGRQYQELSYPVKTFQAQNGKEVRLNYGDRPFGSKLTLTYQNINDSEAEQFFDHWRDQQGTFKDFEILTSETSQISGILTGYLGDTQKILGSPIRRRWRYAAPPSVQHTFRGRSTVTIELVSVIVG